MSLRLSNRLRTAVSVVPPMTLGNMRTNGVRTLAVYCGARGCSRQAVLDVSRCADDVQVPSFGLRKTRLNWGRTKSCARRLGVSTRTAKTQRP